MNRLLLFLMIFLTSWMKSDPVMSERRTDKIPGERRKINQIFLHITTNHTVRQIVNHPAFKGFGKHFFRGIMTQRIMIRR